MYLQCRYANICDVHSTTQDWRGVHAAGFRGGNELVESIGPYAVARQSDRARNDCVDRIALQETQSEAVMGTAAAVLIFPGFYATTSRLDRSTE